MNLVFINIIFFILFFGIFITLAMSVIFSYIKSNNEEKYYSQWLESSNYKSIAPKYSPKNFKSFFNFDLNISQNDGHSNGLLTRSSFSRGIIHRGFTGYLDKSQNKINCLFQRETRGSGKHRKTYIRTIFEVDIPDTQLQMIINSKINNDASSGGNIQHYTNKQRYQLEGDFGIFFDIYMPDSSQSETLSILTPDSMLYLLVNFADFDIEISGNKLYIYCYKYLKTDSLNQILSNIDTLMKEMKLRKQDTRLENVTNALVARTATDSSTNYRSLKKNFQIIGVLIFITVLVAQFVSVKLYAVLFGAIYIYLIVKIIIDSLVDFRLKRRYKQIVVNYK